MEMRAVILDGTKADDQEARTARQLIEAELKRSGWSFDSETLRDANIAPCRACFTCWLKTPGICVIDDDGQRVTQEMARSDLIVLISPITFGGYSSDLKKAFDRGVLPDLLPFFKKFDGETHHPARYGKPWYLLAIGTMGSDSEGREQLFTDMVARNALNAHSPAHGAVILRKGESPAATRMKLEEALRTVGVSK
jgi:multimeric flavodoxin WrbA